VVNVFDFVDQTLFPIVGVVVAPNNQTSVHDTKLLAWAPRLLPPAEFPHVPHQSMKKSKTFAIKKVRNRFKIWIQCFVSISSSVLAGASDQLAPEIE
jgi:hypothetical protein